MFRFAMPKKYAVTRRRFVTGVAKTLKSKTDPLGSYTGVPDDGKPVQDVDDL